jgi:hypothetical protein
MEKRAILAIVVTFLIIVAWGMLQPKFFPPAPTPVKESKKEEVVPPSKEVEKKTVLKEEKPSREAREGQEVKAVPNKEVTVETENFVAIFTTEEA